MISSYGSMSMYVVAEMAYRQERIKRDFAAINWAAQERAARRARATECLAAAQLAPISTPASASVPAPVRRTWIARLLRTPLPATH